MNNIKFAVVISGLNFIMWYSYSLFYSEVYSVTWLPYIMWILSILSFLYVVGVYKKGIS